MTTPGRAFVAAGCLLVAPLLAVPAQAAPTATRADVAVHTIAVTGDGVGSYPAFDPAIDRYAVTTGAATAGTITITATTADPTGTVYVDGVVDADGTATVDGLDEGDEVAVWIEDAAGTARYSYVYLPAGFPTLEAETAPGADLAPGVVMLGLSGNWLAGLGPDPEVVDFVETALDRNGVPVHVESYPDLPRSMDLKRQPNGSYSVARTTTTPGRTGEAIVELDEQFREVRRWETVGLVNTDGHDAILEADGTAWLMAYETRAEGDVEVIDSVIQRIDPDGTVGFEWSSAGLEDETVVPGTDEVPNPTDYAHINSFEVMADGDLLASFRNLDSVFKIATSDHDGFETGDVVWKLGGRDSTFAFPDGEGGPCAQHTARELANGDILLFDNGSADTTGQLCLPPGDPAGDVVQRLSSRSVVFELDEQAGTASVVRSHERAYAWFAGSTQPLDAGHVLVGWSSASLFADMPVATELDADDEVAWELTDPNPQLGQRYFTYRAHLAEVPDATPPRVDLDVPAVDAVYDLGERVEPSYRCTDRGGSSLHGCAAGGPVGTSIPGAFGYEVTASDGAGNTTTETRPYTVLPAPVEPVGARPDAWVKAQGGRWVGRDVYGTAASQRLRVGLRRVGASTTLKVRLQNDGSAPDRIAYAVEGGRRGLQVSGRSTGRTARLDPGERATIRLTVRRGKRLASGSSTTLRMSARSVSDPSRRDAVSVRVVAR